MTEFAKGSRVEFQQAVEGGGVVWKPSTVVEDPQDKKWVLLESEEITDATVATRLSAKENTTIKAVADLFLRSPMYNGLDLAHVLKALNPELGVTMKLKVRSMCIRCVRACTHEFRTLRIPSAPSPARHGHPAAGLCALRGDRGLRSASAHCR